jgi:cell division septation protein DedD
MLPRLTLLLTILLAFSTQARADDPSQAGLVVQFEGGRVETYCLAFDGDQIAGDELLALSGLELVIDPSSGMGITVCKIEKLGCDYPAEHCFCQCMGGEPCAYWNYFYRDPGQADWTYSPLGAVLRQVRPGAVEAWVWGDGHTPPAADLTFEAICDLPTPTPTTAPPTLTATTAPPSETSEAAASPTPLPPTATATNPPPTPTATPAPNADAAPTLSTYWPFGLMLLGLLALAIFVRLRR